MRSALRIVTARGRMFRRFLVEHAFVLFVLGPMVVGAVAWVAERYLDLLRRPLLGLLEPSAPFPDRASVVLALLATAVLWPSTLREVFGRGDGAQDPIDALPVGEGTRFAVAWTACAARALGLGGVFAAGLWALERSPGLFRATPEVAIFWASAASAFVASAGLVLLLVVVWVPLGWASTGRLLAAVGVVLALVSSPWPWTLWPLAPWAWAGRPLKVGLVSALGSAEGVAGTREALISSAPILGPWLVILLAGIPSAAVFVARRRRDLELGQALDLPRGVRSLGLGVLPSIRISRRPVPASIEAQLRRDLLMILRRFSPAVPAALALALLANLAAVALALDPTLPALWVRRGMVCVSFLGVLALLSLVPFLLKAQLPVFWLERSTGVALEHVWRTKCRLAAFLAVPQVLVGGGLILALAPGGPASTVPAVLQLAVCGAMAASLIGLSVFEIAEQPILGLLFGGFVASAVASLMVFYAQAWWLWLILFGYLTSLVSDRASHRVRYTEVER